VATQDVQQLYIVFFKNNTELRRKNITYTKHKFFIEAAAFLLDG
jgi:hypothetical protein